MRGRRQAPQENEIAATRRLSNMHGALNGTRKEANADADRGQL
jgi:hypothetical protein